jgi:dUTP pyrophosphatase
MRLAVPIKFKKLHEKAIIPAYQSSGAACVDLVATEIEYIEENKVIVKFGFAAEVPDSYKVNIQPRSSFTHKDWVLQNSPGVVDADYRGEWMAKFQAIPIGGRISNSFPDMIDLVYADFPYKVGDRVVQASVEVNVHMKFKETKELSTTIRGDGGFGSTGR